MELNIIYRTSRSAVLEITDGGIFHTQETYVITVNQKEYGSTNQVINGIYGLKPDTEYRIRVKGEKEEKSLSFHTRKESFSLDVREFGAKGDGSSDDTCFIQAAIMACPPNGRVYIPAGIYRITSLFLKSNLMLELGKGAVLKAFTNKAVRPVIPGRIRNYEETEEYYLGTWEGNPLTMFAAVIHGMDLENVEIYGEGILDGNAGKNNWWADPKEKGLAWRPRLIFLSHCKNVVIEGIQVRNSPSWTIHPYFCKDLRFLNLSITNPKDSPNTDALDPESCKNVEITGVYFSVGDDCIAIKSGKIYMGRKFKTPSEDIRIRQCCMRDGHGCVTIGSENAGGVKDITVRDCLFLDTDRGLRIKTRRGRGKDAVIDRILLERVQMDGVKTPFAINSYYYCDPDGHTTYVRSKAPLPVDERTPVLKEFTFRDVVCQNCHVAAAFIYGLPEQKIEKIEMDRIVFSFAEEVQEGFPDMMDDLSPMSRSGIYINNAAYVKINQVRIEGQEGDAYLLKNIDHYEEY